MQAKYTRLFFFIFTLFLSFQSKATHIVGGEINYRCLGNDQYELTMTVFRDCFNGIPNFDDPAHIGIFDINNNLVSSIAMQGVLDIPYVYDDTIDPELLNPCLVVPPNVCVDVTTYSAIVTLPFLAGGYNIVYQRCCRNMTIQNIINPEGTGATYNIFITEQALQECNSSAVFKEWPPTYICVNLPIMIDHSALDAEGDSLVYRMCTPLHGAEQESCLPNNQQVPCFDPLQPCGPIPCPPFNPPFTPITWQAPYHEGDMLGGTPLAIDAETGFLTGTPNLLGQFVVGICLDEYRDGSLISSTRRDFQYNVGDCGQTTSAFFAPEVQCDGLDVDFINGSSEANDFLWYFNYPIDPTATSELENPSYLYPDTGVYTVMLIAEPGEECTDTAYHDIYLQNPTLTAEFDYEFIGCTDVLVIEVSDLSYDTFSTVVAWEWELRSSQGFLLGTSDEQNPSFSISTSTVVTLELTVIAENGCRNFLSESFPVQVFSSDILPDQIIGCLRDSVELNPDPYLNATYQWSPPDGLNDPTAPNPLAAPEVSTTYDVYVVNEFDCEIWDTVDLVIVDDITFLTGSVNPDTIYLGQSAQLTSTNDPSYTYQWLPAESLDDPTIYNPLATPPVTTDYTLIATDTNGCTNSIILRVVVVDPPCIDPHIFMPNAFTPNGDGENDVLRLMGNSIDVMYLTIYDRWGEKVFESDNQEHGWDGTFKGEKLPPDVYGYYLEVKCFNGRELFKKGNIALLK